MAVKKKTHKVLTIRFTVRDHAKIKKYMKKEGLDALATSIRAALKKGDKIL